MKRERWGDTCRLSRRVRKKPDTMLICHPVSGGSAGGQHIGGEKAGGEASLSFIKIKEGGKGKRASRAACIQGVAVIELKRAGLGNL